jgi:hypothetical protein
MPDKKLNFQFTLRGTIEVRAKEHQSPTVEAWVEVLDAEGKPIQYDKDYTVRGGTTYPLACKTIEEANALVHAIHERFSKDVPNYLLRESLNFLHDLREVEGEFGLDETRDTVEFHLRETAEFLNEYFGIKQPQKRTGRAMWTKDDLERAVRELLKPLPSHERSYAKAAKEMKKIFPERAPASGESLRKLCERLDVDLGRLIKRGGKRTGNDSSV